MLHCLVMATCHDFTPSTLPSSSTTHTLAFSPRPPTQIGAEYGSGRMVTSQIKDALIAVLVPMVEAHQAARKGVTDDVVKAFMAVRPLEFEARTPAQKPAV